MGKPLFTFKHLLPALLLGWSYTAFAELPQECIQSPQRELPCERLIYKLVSLTDPVTKKKESKMVCICLADFEELIFPAKTDAEKRLQQDRLKLYSAQLGLPEQEILDMVRY